ncbi:MAG: hypothetical protein IJM18_02560 [Clostridia bacterium]|nr:hypothetical protein [Clostridia bacterium]
MDTLVMFFSFTGRTHYEAKRKAEEVEGELYEVREQKRRSLWSAYLFGPYQARRRKPVIIEPVAINLEEYDRIILMCPVWGGMPAPAFNAMLKELPSGKTVDVLLTSDSGKARSAEELKKRMELSGLKVGEISVIKTMDLRKRDRLHDKKRRRQMREKQ